MYLRGDSLEAQQGGSQKVYIYENTDSGETGGSGTVVYSALSYAYKVLSMTEEQQAAFDSDENNAANQWTYANLKPLVQAMYLYNQAAVAYFNEVNSMEG